MVYSSVPKLSLEKRKESKIPGLKNKKKLFVKVLLVELLRYITKNPRKSFWETSKTSYL
jgi:hypothetical protein